MNNEARPAPENFFKDWKQREALAEGMIPLIGRLYREFKRFLLYVRQKHGE